jgi:hypothetical protein
MFICNNITEYVLVSMSTIWTLPRLIPPTDFFMYSRITFLNCKVVYEKHKLFQISSIISNNPYNLIFTKKINDSSILITIISWEFLNLWLANEYIYDVTIPTEVIKYNQCCSRWLTSVLKVYE